MVSESSDKPTDAELVSKLSIAFDAKAYADEKAQHTRRYAGIWNRQTTPPSDVRQIFSDRF